MSSTPNCVGKFFLVAIDSEALKEAFAKARHGTDRVVCIVAPDGVWMGDKRGGLADLAAIDLEKLANPETATLEQVNEVLTTRKANVDATKHNPMVRLDV